MEKYKAAGKKTPVPSFNTFHPQYAKRFYDLVCYFMRDEFAHRRLFPKKEFMYYSEEHVSSSEEWRQIGAPAQVGYIKPEFLERINLLTSFKPKEQNTNPIFKPRFRVVIGGTPIRTAIYGLS